MPGLSILLIVLSLVFLVLSILIYQGKTELIMEHHLKGVKDLAAYGKDMGKVLFCISATLVVSGILSFHRIMISIAMTLLVTGLLGSILYWLRIQKKHSGKIL